MDVEEEEGGSASMSIERMKIKEIITRCPFLSYFPRGASEKRSSRCMEKANDTIINTVIQKPVSIGEIIERIEGLEVDTITQEPLPTEGKNEEALDGVTSIEAIP